MRSSQPIEIVTIAASAGGVLALRRLLSALPSDFPLPVVIVQHRMVHTPDLLPRVLGRTCRLPVELARAGERPLPGRVYIAPADRHLVVGSDYRFAMTDGRKIHYVRSSADPLFASAAVVSGGRVLAVILTGGDSDGSDGVLAVKAAGGIVIAQDAATSECFSMPQSAIRTGAVDFILPLDEIGPMLVTLATPQVAGSDVRGYASGGGL
jgi:two-component system, chemotaxis family, protein-glutamate methylesterase/glutaminase